MTTTKTPWTPWTDEGAFWSGMHIMQDSSGKYTQPKLARHHLFVLLHDLKVLEYERGYEGIYWMICIRKTPNGTI